MSVTSFLIQISTGLGANRKVVPFFLWLAETGHRWLARGYLHGMFHVHEKSEVIDQPVILYIGEYAVLAAYPLYRYTHAYLRGYLPT